MPRKLLENPPSVSSSDEEEAVTSGEEEEETLPIPEPKPTASESDSDELDESSSESESEDSPVAPKPTEEPATPAEKPKRAAATPAAGEPSNASKRVKKSSPIATASPQDDQKSGGGDEKKLFQRVWSVEDELVILKGMADYIVKNGSFSLAAMDAFYDSVKKSLPHSEFSKAQLTRKLRRLREKYVKSKKRKHEPSKPNDRAALELSRTIWSGNSVSDEPNSNGAAVKTAAKSKGKNSASVKSTPEPMVKFETEANGSGLGGDLAAWFSNSLPEYVVKQGLEMVSGEKKAELEAKWREIHVAELELFAKRTRLMSEQAELVWEALKSQDA